MKKRQRSYGSNAKFGLKQGQSRLSIAQGRNDYFGEIGLMQQSRRKASVIVPQNSKAQLIAIDPESFLKMVSESDLTYAAISHRLCQRLVNDLKRS